MNKKTFANRLSKKKWKYEATIEQEDLDTDDDISCTSRTAAIRQDVLYDSDFDSDSDADSHNRYLFEEVFAEDDDEDQPQFDKALELKAWAIRNNISQMALTDLLQTLDKVGVNGFPLSAKTLLGTTRKKVNIGNTSRGVRAAKTKHSISRNTGDMWGEEYLELDSKLPMTSEEQLRFVEKQLHKKESRDALMRLLVKLKGNKGTLDDVLRGLFTDELVYHYNLKGRKGKKPLLGLKCIGLVFDLFLEKDRKTICEELRCFVVLSHNRLKQKKYKLRSKLKMEFSF